MTLFYRDGNDWKEFTLPENQNGGIIEAYDKNKVPFSPRIFFKPVSDFNEELFKFSKEICVNYAKRTNNEPSEVISPEYIVRDEEKKIRGYLFRPRTEAILFKDVIEKIMKEIERIHGKSDIEKNLYKKYAYFSFVVRISFSILQSLKKIRTRGFFLPELTGSVFFVTDWNNSKKDPLLFFPCADDIACRYYAKGEKKSVLSVSEDFIVFLRRLLLTKEFEKYLSEELKQKLALPPSDISDLFLSLCSFIGKYQYITPQENILNITIKKTFSLKKYKEDKNGIFQETEEKYRLYAGSKTPVYIYDPLTHQLLWLYYANRNLYIKNENYVECKLNVDDKNRLYIPRDSLSKSCIEIQIKDDLVDQDIHSLFPLTENKIVISESKG